MKIEQVIKKYKDRKKDDNYYYDEKYYAILNEIIKDLENLDFVQNKILLVEDGSINLEVEEGTLNKMGYKVIVYRQGANKPEILGEFVKNLKMKLDDSETWQKACELACSKLVDYELDNKESTHSAQYWFDYFYQQAKMEVE